MVPEDYFLIADTAFPHGTASIEGKIRAPLKGGEHVPRDCAAREHLMSFNRQLLLYCQTAEWGMWTIQGSFGWLRVPLKIGSSASCLRLLETTVRLTNLRARCVGISQIRNVYMPIWKASEDEQLWVDLGDMAFGDVRKWDRVSRFHLVVVDEE